MKMAGMAENRPNKTSASNQDSADYVDTRQRRERYGKSFSKDEIGRHNSEDESESRNSCAEENAKVFSPDALINLESPFLTEESSSIINMVCSLIPINLL